MCYELLLRILSGLVRPDFLLTPEWVAHTETNLMRKVFEWDLPEQNKLSVAKERRDREGRRAGRTRQVGCYSLNTAFSQNDPEDQEIRQHEETERPDSTVEGVLLLQTPIL